MDAKKILVAEDDAFLREVYKETLTRGGYSVITAINGEDALVKIKEQGLSMVLLDIVMPELDGISVLKKAREDPGFDTDHKIPIIFLTNLDNDNEIKEALSIGNGYLIKSQLTPGQLLADVGKKLAGNTIK